MYPLMNFNVTEPEAYMPRGLGSEFRMYRSQHAFGNVRALDAALAYTTASANPLARFSPIARFAHLSPNACRVARIHLSLHASKTGVSQTSTAPPPQPARTGPVKQAASNVKSLHVAGRARVKRLRPSAGLLCISSCRPGRRRSHSD